MTINATSVRKEYAGNGVTTAFSYPYRFLANGDLTVLLVDDATGVETVQTLTTHYTVTGAGDDAGGTVTFVTAPATGKTVVIYNDPDLTQGVNLVNNDPLPVETAVEAPLDRLTLIAQRLSDRLDRAVTLPDGDSGFVAGDMQLPAKVDRASKYSAWDADGKPIASAAQSGTPTTAFMVTVLDDPDGATAIATLVANAGVEAATNTLTTLPEVADMATLRALSWSNGRRAFMRCHTTAGDGGHGIFRRVTGAAPGTYTHNGGTILVAAAGDGSAAWLRDYVGAINVKWFGATGDGATDDAVAIQAVFDNCNHGDIVYFPRPPSSYLIGTRLSLSKSVILRGDTQYISSVLCNGCSGLIINKISNVQIENLEFAAAVRYTTTPNALVGIEVDGDTVNRPFNHIYRNVYVDGFLTAYKLRWLWASVFDNCRSNNGKDGILALNLSVNNVVSKCTFGGEGSGIGISLDGAGSAGEGWVISNTVIDSFDTAIVGQGFAHVFVTNNILDHNSTRAILIADDGGSNFGGNFTIRGNYVGMSGASGAAAIESTNAISSSQNRGNIVTNNQVLVYSGSACTRGIYMSGAEAVNNVIVGNTVKGFTTSDVECLTAAAGNDVIANNNCQSAITNNIVGGTAVSGNSGQLLYERARQYIGGLLPITWDEAAPTNGTWPRGAWCMNVVAAAGGTPGWVCTTAGSPGTWKAMANVAA